jgi:mannosyltransferase
VSGRSPALDGPARTPLEQWWTGWWLSGLTAILLITVLAAAIALIGIGDESLWLDESTSFDFARMDWSNFWRATTGSEINATLYYLVLRGWVLLGTSEVWLRALSALFAVAAIPVVWRLAADLFGNRIAAVAALLLVLNPYYVQYAQEARSYSLTILLVSASALALMHAVRRPTALRWAAYAALAAAGLYAHVFAAFVILAQAFAVLLGPVPGRAKRAFLVASAAIALLGVPIAIAVLTPGNAFVSWIQAPSALGIVRTAVLLTGGHVVLTALYGVVLLVAAVQAVIDWRADPSRRFALLLTFAWLVVPPVVAVGVSAIKPILNPRYLIVVLPAMAILAAYGIGRLPHPRLAAAALLLLISLSVVRLAVQATTLTKEDWRGATALVLARVQPDDAIFFYTQSGAKPFAYYVDQRGAADQAPRSIYPNVTWTSPYPLIGAQRGLDTALQDLGHNHRVWLVVTHEEGRLASLSTVLAGLSASYAEHEAWALRGVDIRLFEAGP